MTSSSTGVAGAPATPPQDATAGSLLTLNNIEVIYDDVILVLRGQSLSVPQGKICLLYTSPSPRD